MTRRTVAMLAGAMALAACAASPSPSRPTMSPSQERLVDFACQEWADGLRELSGDREQVCRLRGFGR